MAKHLSPYLHRSETSSQDLPETYILQRDFLLSDTSPDYVGQQVKSSTQQRFHFTPFLVALGYMFLGGVNVGKGVWGHFGQILEVSWEKLGYCSWSAIRQNESRLFTKLYAASTPHAIIAAVAVNLFVENYTKVFYLLRQQCI